MCCPSTNLSSEVVTKNRELGEKKDEIIIIKVENRRMMDMSVLIFLKRLAILCVRIFIKLKITAQSGPVAL